MIEITLSNFEFGFIWFVVGTCFGAFMSYLFSGEVSER